MTAARRTQHQQPQLLSFALLLILGVGNQASSRIPGGLEMKIWDDLVLRKQETVLKNQRPFEIEYEEQLPRAHVLDATVKCLKTCNYAPFFDEEEKCFGSFMFFADGHILETTTRVNCLGFYRNMTLFSEDSATVETVCTGEFEQVQVMHVYEPITHMKEGLTTFLQADGFYSSYSCRHEFVMSKTLKLTNSMEPSLLSGNVKMSCDADQSVRIQKGYCACSEAACNGAQQKFKTFAFTAASNEGTVPLCDGELRVSCVGTALFNRTRRRFVSREMDVGNPVTRNFKKLAERDPELARRIATAIVESVTARDPEGVQNLLLPPEIVEYYVTENIYVSDTFSDPPSWSSQPATSWLHVLCNGGSSAFASNCNGVLSANVRFGRSGSAFIACKGGWRAYEDVTYVCDGALTEDESDHNTFGSYFSKVSRCSGTVAISPSSTNLGDGFKYYGLSEFCHGHSTLRASYVLEQLDHRYVGHTVDPKTVQQIICLMADRNCEQLRYFT